MLTDPSFPSALMSTVDASADVAYFVSVASGTDFAVWAVDLAADPIADAAPVLTCATVLEPTVAFVAGGGLYVGAKSDTGAHVLAVNLTSGSCAEVVAWPGVPSLEAAAAVPGSATQVVLGTATGSGGRSFVVGFDAANPGAARSSLMLDAGEANLVAGVGTHLNAYFVSRGAAPRVVEVAGVAGNCSSHLSCDACQSGCSCGWCASTQTCLAGQDDGWFSDDAGLCTIDTWEYYDCLDCGAVLAGAAAEGA